MNDLASIASAPGGAHMSVVRTVARDVVLLTTVTLAATGCAQTLPATAQAPPGGGTSAVAPNDSVVGARVLDAEIVESITLGIEPPQPLCVLTLELRRADTSPALLPKDGEINRPIRIYAKDTALVSLKGGSITAAVELRGDGQSERLWLVRVIDSSPPR